YTTGIRASWTWTDAPPSISRFAASLRQNLFDQLPILSPVTNPGTETITAGLATQYYTSDSPEGTGLEPKSRPFAGYVYLDWIDRIQRLGEHSAIHGEDYFEFQIGMVGPIALSKEIQNWFHNDIWPNNSPTFRGWRNQLHNEPVF